MAIGKRNGVVLAIYVAILITGESDGGVRPSDHGLTYQDFPAAGENSTELAGFFDGSTAASDVALPEAKNMSASATWYTGGVGRKDGGDHVRHVMLVATVVCGITGVTLLVVSAFLYVRFRQQACNNKHSLST